MPKFKLPPQRLRGQRRESLYQSTLMRYGVVPCYVCREHVRRSDATLEHILALSKGGADAMSNYAISHRRCNSLKGDKIIARLVGRGDA